MQEALGQLRDTYRQCIILREIEGRSYEDIAEILECGVRPPRQARNIQAYASTPSPRR
jgi:hypothetical protein